MASPPKRRKSQSETNERPGTPHFTIETLLHLLYGKKIKEPIDLEKSKQSSTYCDICCIDRPPHGCSFHEPKADRQEDVSYALKSFPPEVQLCTSSIPGARYGVCAKRVIPKGTWIGPYEGKRLKPAELSQNLDNSYVWEIYENGQASGYIDGSDESSSSWMRYIRCARSKAEQNLYAFQYLGNVFYRSFKEISPGTEMLVWYDEKYLQYMGIPMGLQEIEFVNANDIEQNRRSPTREQLNDDERTQKNLSTSQRKLEYQSVHPSQRLPTSSHSSVTRATQRVSPAAQESCIYSREIPKGQRLIPVSGYAKTEIPAPVNISVGIPSQGITGRLPGRVYPGITGAQNAAVQERTLNKGTANWSVAFPHDNDIVTSSNIQANTGKLCPQAHTSVFSRPSSQPSDLRNKSCTVSVVSSNVHAVSTDSEVRTSCEDRRRGGRLSYLPYHEVTEEDLRQRGYLVKDDSRRPKSTRRRQTPSRMGAYVWKDEDDIFDQKLETGEAFEDIKATESDSNSSSSSKEVGSTSEEVGSTIDEISMWRCRQCQKTFTQRVQLQIHVCPNEPFKPYRCGQCEMSFDTATDLRSHVDTHASEKPFKCGFCSRSFAGATTLNNHIRTHMGKRPFNCECGKSFAQAGQLARHQRTPGECEHIRAKNNY